MSICRKLQSVNVIMLQEAQNSKILQIVSAVDTPARHDHFCSAG